MATRAEIIDNFFRSLDAYSWIPYQPIGRVMVDEVERMGPNGLYLSTAAALVEKESGGKSLFGCDHGSRWTNEPPYCQVAVTAARVKALIRNINSGGGQNGVGLTQLTSIGFVKEAERLGGAHLPRYQMRVGFRYLNSLITQLGFQAGASAFNAGASNWRAVYDTYGADIVRLEREWAARLAKASNPGGDVPEWQRTTLVPPWHKKLAPRAGDYQDRHPTRYNFRPDVADLVKRLYAKYPGLIHINTYHDHPEGYWRTEDSFDVWGPDGRNDPVPSNVGTEIRNWLFNLPGLPNIDWIIWQRRIWIRAEGYWKPFGGNPFEWHDDHVHVTYVR